MNFFCRILGHTWIPVTEGGNPRWNTTKAGNILQATEIDEGIRYYDECRRCGDRRDVRVKGNYDGRGAASAASAPRPSAVQDLAEAGSVE